MDVISVERQIDCASDVCSVWGALSDTERMNRAVGNQPLSLSPLRGRSAARYLARTRLGGFQIEYEERPYEWVYLKEFKILRRLRQGPVSSFEAIFRLAPLPDGGTRVTVECRLTPRVAFLRPLMKLSATQVMRRMEQEIRRMDADLAAGRIFTPDAPIRVDADALARAVESLEKQERSSLVARLARLIREGGDLDVSRLRPYALADSWGVDRRAMLETCLRAVKAGLLELRWDIVCPSCRTVSNTIPSLSALTEHGACQLCDIQFGLELDRAVEATFAPARAIRQVDEGPYCIGGPARMPHIVAQAILPSEGTAALVTPEEAGAYRVFVRGGFSAPVRVGEGAPATLRIEPGSKSDRPLSELAVAPGGSIEVVNRGADERHAKLERIEWLNQAATAREVTALAEFRRDFSSDVLRPGTTLKISRMGIFFSDLSDSTQLYATAGDAVAFKLVQDHFDVLVPIIERRGGAVVKTIGDAVMAVFSDELAGLAASREILAEFQKFRAATPERQRTNLKLGFFSGPCFVLTANKVLDYFGQTVNIAARLQGQARGGELIIEERFADEAIRAGALPASEVIERSTPVLKGVEQSIRVARISVRAKAEIDAA